jgi:hypothetical protein
VGGRREASWLGLAAGASRATRVRAPVHGAPGRAPGGLRPRPGPAPSVGALAQRAGGLSCEGPRGGSRAVGRGSAGRAVGAKGARPAHDVGVQSVSARASGGGGLRGFPRQRHARLRPPPRGLGSHEHARAGHHAHRVGRSSMLRSGRLGPERESPLTAGPAAPLSGPSAGGGLARGGLAAGRAGAGRAGAGRAGGPAQATPEGFGGILTAGRAARPDLPVLDRAGPGLTEGGDGPG